MAMSKKLARSIIVVGIIELVVACISAILGGISLAQIHGHPSSSVGLWMLCYGIPGILSIAAGRTKSTPTMGVALVFNVIATAVSAFGTIKIIILGNDLSYLECNEYQVDCSNLDKDIAIIAVVTFVLCLLATTSFIGCILGCIGTCCTPPVPIIITTIPAKQSTVVVNTQTSTQFPPSTYHSMFRQNVAGSPMPGYFGPPAPAYGVQAASSTVAKDDDEPLVENIV